MTTRRSRPGRPRHVPDSSTTSPRDQILDAASRLFVSQGFAATSTREIADMVGIRQASLYYHFAGKDEILAELLRRSVRPTTDKVHEILAQVPPLDYETALYLLVLVDVRTLADVPHNVGMLYQLPDVAKCEVYDEFRTEHDELSEHYARLAGEVASKTVRSAISFKQLGDLLIQMVEAVINMRTENPNRRIPCSEAWAIAASCLRICGVDQAKIEAAAPIAIDLLPRFMEDKVAEPA
ncbi:TetR family transcriptional regulator [Nocardioides albertanoniae]|uniref:TetR family transcriptional regulator n=2 Tax=Nocardioides albertanoniae TaxID=1175486 RepID=A0A543A8S8_9ACTN|nr:TetR/AcrR family transcriptional regulator [Nocardioides albertanoniae]TQL69004.1 TetR family transcriptional regulator [Nocardioides albertanoniae]